MLFVRMRVYDYHFGYLFSRFDCFFYILFRSLFLSFVIVYISRMCVRALVCVCVSNYRICGSFSYDSNRNCFGACGSYMNYMYTKRRRRRRRRWRRPSVYLNIIVLRVCVFVVYAKRDSGIKAEDIRLTKKIFAKISMPTPHMHRYTVAWLYVVQNKQANKIYHSFILYIHHTHKQVSVRWKGV